MKQIIDAQIGFNDNKNLFTDSSIMPTELTKKFVTEGFIKILNESDIDELIDYTVDKVLQLFMQRNQFINFNSEDRKKFRQLYLESHKKLVNISNQKEIDQIFQLHYQNLQKLLIETNGNKLFEVYRKSLELPLVVNEEYSIQLQSAILNISETLIEPILDVGCGSKANLVTSLRKKELDAHGFDRILETSQNYLFEANWLEFDFEPNYWGTIISHMAFSNHFNHHNMREDGKYEAYARKYMQILNSLKIGGTFIYSPGLPFIEDLLLQNSKFTVKRFSINAKEKLFTTHITKNF